MYFYPRVYLQLLDGLDVLQRNTLTSLKQELIANNLIGTYRNLTVEDFIGSEMTTYSTLLCTSDVVLDINSSGVSLDKIFSDI